MLGENELNEEDVTREEVEAFLGEGAPAELLDDYEVSSSDGDNGDGKSEDSSSDNGGSSDGDSIVDGDSGSDIADDNLEKDDNDDKSSESDDKEKQQDSDSDDKEEQEADIESKSGKYTIPYAKLEKAREDAKLAKESQALLQAEVDKLKSKLVGLNKDNQAEESSDGEKSNPDGNDESLKLEDDLAEEFPETAKLISDLKAKIDTLTKDNEERAKTTAEQETLSHFEKIDNAIDNAEELLQSKELQDWIESKPSIIRDAYKTTFEKGTAEQVIEMAGAFIEETSPEGPQKEESSKNGKGDKVDVSKAVEEAKAKGAVPNSLSDIPGDKQPADPVELLSNASNAGALVDDMFAGKTQEQINALLEKML